MIVQELQSEIIYKMLGKKSPTTTVLWYWLTDYLLHYYFISLQRGCVAVG